VSLQGHVMCYVAETFHISADASMRTTAYGKSRWFSCRS